MKWLLDPLAGQGLEFHLDEAVFDAVYPSNKMRHLNCLRTFAWRGVVTDDVRFVPGAGLRRVHPLGAFQPLQVKPACCRTCVTTTAAAVILNSSPFLNRAAYRANSSNSALTCRTMASRIGP